MFQESACQETNCLLNYLFHNDLTKNKAKVSYIKITHIFSSNKIASTESHNYPINLVFSVNKNLVYFWSVFFFLMLVTIFHKIWHLGKKMQKNAKMSFLYEQDLIKYACFELYRVPWENYLENLEIEKKNVSKQVQLFIQCVSLNHVEKKNLLEHHNKNISLKIASAK